MSADRHLCVGAWFSAEESAGLRAAAKAAGRTLSEHLRWSALAQLDRDQNPPVILPPGYSGQIDKVS